MPETRERDQKHNFIDFIEMLFVTFWEEPRKGDITIIGVPRHKRKSEIFKQLKEQAEDVEFEEIQG